MKKIFTSFFAISIATLGFGQSIHIWESSVDYTDDTIDIAITAGSMNLDDLELHNTTATIINYQVNRTILNAPIDSCQSLYYCTGTQCYSPNWATTWTPTGPPAVIGASANLPSGPGTYGISAHYDACATICTDLYVLYRVYNTQVGTNDTAFVTMHYMCASGINESELATGSLSSAYPNPASSAVSMKYEVTAVNSGKIVIYDMLGKTVKEIALTDKQGIAKINVADLNVGVYFYALVVNEKAITTKKLIISSK